MYNCCEHCEHAYDDTYPNNHKVPCSAGCNDDEIMEMDDE